MGQVRSRNEVKMVKNGQEWSRNDVNNGQVRSRNEVKMVMNGQGMRLRWSRMVKNGQGMK